MQWLYIFALYLSINDYKNICSHNVCIMVFHKNCLYNGFSYELLACDGFYKNCLFNGFSHELLVCDSFLYRLFLLKLFFSMKRGYVCVWEACKIVWVLWVCFLKYKLFLIWKGVMCMFGGRVKMCKFCRYAFWNLKVYKQKFYLLILYYHFYHYDQYYYYCYYY